MRIDDITIQVRSLALGNLGEIDKAYINDAKIVKRFNNVGYWSFSLPAEYDMATVLSAPGRGVRISGPGWIVSGGMISVVRKDSVEDPQGTLFFTGSDDMIHLSDGRAFPSPAVADVSAQTSAYDIRTGATETVMREYVDNNRGPSAPADRQIPGLTLQPDLGRGAAIIGRARFDVLGQLLSDLSLQGGGLGFDMVQIGEEIQFTVYEPQDKSDVIRMDIANDMLTDSEYGYGAPTATRAIVSGQGQGADRRFIQITTPESLAAESLWGRKIETLKDRRDTDDDAELVQEGTGIVAANGDTIKSLSVTPTDDIANQEFGLDWFLGDKVGVVVEEQPLSAVVTEVVILMDELGVRVSATLGDPVGFDYDSKLLAAQQDQEKRISALEKSSGDAAASASGYLIGVAYPWAVATIPSWAVELNGQAVSRITYSGLFAMWGTTFGAGDGSTTFNVPDWRGRVPVGYKAGDSNFGTMGQLVGEATHTLTIAEMPSHSHQWNAAGTNSPGSVPANWDDIVGGNVSPLGVGPASPETTSANAIRPRGGDAAHNNVQPSVTVKWIVCAATSSGDFDTEVQTALVNRMGDAEAAIDLLETRPQGRIPASVVVGSGSASVAADGTITFTAVSSLSLNGMFDGIGQDTYDVYLRNTVTSTSGTVIRFRAAGIDSASGYDTQRLIISTTTGGAQSLNLSEGLLILTSTIAGEIMSTRATIMGPKLAAPTTVLAHGVQTGNPMASNSSVGEWFNSILHRSSAAYDGMTILVSTGTMSGTMKVVKVS